MYSQYSNKSVECRIDKNKGKSRFTDKAIGFLEGILLNNAILSFAKGLSSVTVFKAASFLMSITVSVIIARTLGPEATGTIGVVQTAANFLMIPMVTDTLKLIAEDLWQYSIVIAVIINLGIKNDC